MDELQKVSVPPESDTRGEVTLPPCDTTNEDLQEAEDRYEEWDGLESVVLVARTIRREEQLKSSLSSNLLLREENERLTKEAERANSSRVHTQKWYASHYGRLQDWAQQIGPPFPHPAAPSEDPMHVYFTDIRHGTGARSIYLYACLYEYETGDLTISADMPYCLKVIKERGWIVVKGPKAPAPLMEGE